MMHEYFLPRFIAAIIRWPWRKFTGRQLDALTWPLPPVILWLTPEPDEQLRVHEITHCLQVLDCYPETGPWAYRVCMGGIVAMWTWLKLWRQCGYSYWNHPWEVEAREHAGQV